jgi:uncharacterized protein with HEPN domain
MQRDPKKYAHDMIESCLLIEKFISGRTSEDFNRDPLLRSAVERQFQIIGEALQQLHKVAPLLASQISEYRTIINFRHILVHGYDRIENDVVWGIAQTHIRLLLEQASRIIQDQ